MPKTDPPPTVTPVPVLAPRWRREAAWTAVGVVAIGIVYFAQSGPEPRRALDALGGDRAPAASVERSQVDSPAVSISSEAPPSTAPALAAETTGASAEPQAKAEVNVAKALPSPAGTKTSRAATASVNANKDARASSGAYALASDAATGRSNAPSETETSQLVAQASISRTVSPTNGAQALASAMEKCGTEAFLSRFICEQKMYMQYCEDKWEKDPRCMRKTGNN